MAPTGCQAFPIWAARLMAGLLLSAYPDGRMWFLYWLGQESYVGEVDVFAFECWVVAGPKFDERSQIFVGYRATFGEGFGVL